MQKETITRILHCGKAQCGICGAEFEKHTGNQRYCSNECSLEAMRKFPRKPKPWKPPRDIVCIKCGNTFRGKGRQLICQDCLYTRPDCRRYIDMRSERYEVKDEQSADS